MKFVHLHVHSQYSFLDGGSSLDSLLGKATMLDMSAIAITDHNRLTGAIRFYEKAKAIGLKPIIGAEVEMEGGYHLTLLCKNRQGYVSLCRLLTHFHLSNHGEEPAITKEHLQQHHSGLIALSGCHRGELFSLVRQGREEKAKRVSDFYRKTFGEDYFVELIRYPSREVVTINHSLVSHAREEGIPIVATNNVHHTEIWEYKVKEVLNAISKNSPLPDLAHRRTIEQYLKSQSEMTRLFSDIPEAVRATEEIALKCNLELELGKSHFPLFDVPKGQTDYSYLSHLACEGMTKRYSHITSAILERLERELSTIKRLGFCSYFLVVWDIVREARMRNVRCQARGSAVDSLVVYALGISGVDPIEHDLLFERFMHPSRKEPPDIDLDIDRRQRDKIRNYICQKYGAENVACVGTINTYMARGAIRDVGKAMQVPQCIIEEACKGIHYLSVTKLLEHADSLPELKDNTIYRRSELISFFNICAAIDGFPKHLSVHLGGLLIGNSKLTNMVPLERASGGDIISQYDKDDIEKLGIIKLDLLSLPTITVIEDTLTNIEKSHGNKLDITRVPRGDPKVFHMLRDGKTIGTFQLESPAQREMAGRLLPNRFNDIVVSLSLVRPGPLKSSMDKEYLLRRHGKLPVTYLHPKLKAALQESLGVILYQEQVLKVTHDLAGMSYAEADGFRRAMTHNRTEREMEGMRASFIFGTTKNGVDRRAAERVFEQLAAFAAYGFCKAHAATYAVLAYQTLWLKCHYPAEYFAAVLSNQPMGYYPPRVLLAEAKRSGVKVLPPDINKSVAQFSVEKGAMRVGLKQLRGISVATLRSIIRERGNGRFTTIRDFVSRTGVDQPILKSLVKIGAFDSLEKRTREELLLEITTLTANNQNTKGARFQWQYPHEGSEVMRNTRCSKRETMATERQLLSLDLLGHPLDLMADGKGHIRMKDLPSLPTGQGVTIIGSVIRYQTPPTRNDNRVVYIIMEDGTGIADVTVFSDVQARCGQVLFRAGWLSVKGKIQRRGPRSLSIIASHLSEVSVLNNHRT